MVFWAGNFIVVKGAIEILPPVGFTFLRYLRRVAPRCSRSCAGARARSACRGATSLRIAVLGVDRLRLLPDPVAGRAPDHPGRRLGPAHRRDPGHHGAARRWRSGPTRRTPSKLVGAFVSFAGVALVIGAGQGLVLGASLVGDVLTLRRGRLLGGLHGLRRDDPAAPLAAGDHDLGDPRGDAVHRARSGIAQLVDRRSRRGRADRPRRDPLLRDPGGRRSPTSSSSTRSSCSARPG